MKTVILYYSFSGSTKRWAEAEAAKLSADLKEILETKKRGVFSAYSSGCLKAMKRRKVDVIWEENSLEEYDKIILAAPIWAGSPAPPFNNMVDLLPAGKEVEVFVLSGSGKSAKSRAGTEQMIREKGCMPVGYHDVKTPK